jgi:phosphinothricin acetyltransferase
MPSAHMLRDEKEAMSSDDGKSVKVRAGELEDLPRLTEIYNHYVINTAITFDIEPSTVTRRRSWLEHFAETGRHRLLVAEEAGRLLGYATSGAFRVKPAYQPSVEVSVYCAPEATGSGVGSKLYGALFAELATEDVHCAFAGIALPNEASERLHRRFGFQPVGVFREVGRKFGRYWDVLWTQRIVGD